MSDVVALLSELAARVSPAIAIEHACIDDHHDALWPEERAHVAGAVAERRAAFATARVCARRALARLGIAPLALVPHADRSPRWPPGIVGSISHGAGTCIVAVARSHELAGLGLDIEDDRPLAPAVIARVCTPAERAALPGGDADAIAVFSAKEAFYKAQYPLTGAFLEPEALAIDLADGVFGVVAPAQPWAARARGTFVRGAGIVACVVELS